MTVALLFYPTTSTPGHVNDAGYFMRNAQLAARVWTAKHGLRCVLIPFDNTKPEAQRRQDIRVAVQAYGAQVAGQVSLVAFFCHGWTDGIQAGWTRGTVQSFCDMLRQVGVPGGALLRVVLYACSTGSDRFGHDGDNSFADFVRDNASDHGVNVQVDCHTTPGDATENAHVRRLESPAAEGGAMLADPDSPGFQHLLATTWRFEFPFETRDQVTADVAAAA